ncbi:MAG TPA: glycosyltransferase family 4 protein [Vicinamibacterales bacterium]|nr:glycosyltransferase family 4 protein [Vicinamibacterales bacterium]
MRVVHVVPALFGPDGLVGGAERYAFELARHMAASVPTTLVGFGDVAREELCGPLRVRTLPAWHVRGQRSNPFSLAILRELEQADVVHCHQHHVLMSSVAAAWCRLRGRRVFVSDLGGGGWDVSAYVPTDAWFHGHLHLSEYSRQVFGHAANDRARVVGGGVDIARFSPDPSVARDGGALFVGRLLPHKGVDDLIAGLPRHVPLTIVGPRPDDVTRARLEASARGKDVAFRYGLSDEALVHEYRRALCIVLPSVYRTAAGDTKVPELLGQTLLEGMACGAPALCTRVASMPEVVEDGVTGFVVPPNDPEAIGERLAWLSHNPYQAARMGAAGRERVLRHFTWDAVVSRCLAAYGVELAEAAA